jgi:hypothetical protein
LTILTNAVSTMRWVWSYRCKSADPHAFQSQLADGTKKLFDELRTQLMTQAASSAASSDTQASANVQASGETQATSQPAGAPQGSPPPPPPGGGHHHRGGGMFSKIASLLDQYRSTATDTTATTEASALSVAA